MFYSCILMTKKIYPFFPHDLALIITLVIWKLIDLIDLSKTLTLNVIVAAFSIISISGLFNSFNVSTNIPCSLIAVRKTG